MADVEYPLMRVVEVIQRCTNMAAITQGEERQTHMLNAALLQQQLQGIGPGDKTVILHEDVARELDRVLG